LVDSGRTAGRNVHLAGSFGGSRYIVLRGRELFIGDSCLDVVNLRARSLRLNLGGVLDGGVFNGGVIDAAFERFRGNAAGVVDCGRALGNVPEGGFVPRQQMGCASGT